MLFKTYSINYIVSKFTDMQKTVECTYKDGKYTAWHKNGKKSREYTYKDGKLDGTYKEWTENGQIITEWTYKEGKFNGLCNDYIRCGYNHPEIDTIENKDIWYKHRITTYKDNIRETCIRLYYKPHTSSFWLNKITEYVRVHNIDADISEEMISRLLGFEQFKNNKLHGQCIGIDTALNVLVICGYKDGQYHGEYEMWNPDGVLLEHKVYDENVEIN